MKKIIKKIMSLSLAFLVIVCVACGDNRGAAPEKITLAETVLSEVEFKNSDKVKIKQDGDELVISGEIEKMSDAQKSVFGAQDVTHVVILKFEFDKERTIDYFKIQGNMTKVYSTDKQDENYVGSISSLLDNEDSEDSFCYLILSASTTEYILTSRYSDDFESKIKIKIDATLVTAQAQD